MADEETRWVRGDAGVGLWVVSGGGIEGKGREMEADGWRGAPTAAAHSPRSLTTRLCFLRQASLGVCRGGL